MKENGQIIIDNTSQSNLNYNNSYEIFQEILAELLDELPGAFFKELHGGVVISEEAPLSEYDRGNTLYVFGRYSVSSIGRQITIYKGSFDKFYGTAYESSSDYENIKNKLREVLRHEFRHHMEFLSDIHNSESLEREDERAVRAYLGKF